MSFKLSYWERTSFFEEVDVCIIGGGLVGLHSAIALMEQQPRLKVLVVERGFLPYGASTRNAGFACFGSMTELLDDLTREDESSVFDRVQLRWEGLVRLREITGDGPIDYEPLGGYELFTPDEASDFVMCSEKMAWFNSKLKAITGVSEVYQSADQRIRSFGFGNTDHLILNTAEGQLDTGKMMLALEHRARSLGVRIVCGLEATHIESGMHPVVHTARGFSFSAAKVLVTTNAFAQQLLPTTDVRPARAQVLITQPVANLPFRGSFHYDKGYYYFRNVGDRVLFGGGRNLDFEAEATATFGLTDPVQQRLEQLLKEVILPSTRFEIDMRWSGIMGLGPNRSTIIRETASNTYCAVRMGGMGVAIGSMVGVQAAKMVLG